MVNRHLAWAALRALPAAVLLLSLLPGSTWAAPTCAFKLGFRPCTT